MNKNIRNILIIIGVLFLSFIILRITNGMAHITAFFTKYQSWLSTLGFMLFIGGVFWYFVFYRNKNEISDPVHKCWTFLQDWWFSQMGQHGDLKLEGAIIKRGFYTSQTGDTEMFVGFNVVRQSNQKRVCFIVSTKPICIVWINNSINIGETDDPFKGFYAINPTPISNYDDSSLKTKMAGSAWRGPPRMQQPKNDDDWVRENREGQGNAR